VNIDLEARTNHGVFIFINQLHNDLCCFFIGDLADSFSSSSATLKHEIKKYINFQQYSLDLLSLNKKLIFHFVLVLTPVRRLRRRALPITRGSAPSNTAAPLRPMVVPVAALGL
jgi:hypothetical protein